MDPVRQGLVEEYFERVLQLAHAVNLQWQPLEEAEDKERAPRPLKLVPEPVTSSRRSDAILYHPAAAFGILYSIWYKDLGRRVTLLGFSMDFNLPCQVDPQKKELRVKEALAGIFSQHIELMKPINEMVDLYCAHLKTMKEVLPSAEYERTEGYRNYEQARAWIERWYFKTREFYKILEDPRYRKDITALFGNIFDLSAHVSMAHCHAITNLSGFLAKDLPLHSLLHFLKDQGGMSNLDKDSKKVLIELVTGWNHQLGSYPIQNVHTIIRLGLKALVALDPDLKQQDHHKRLARLIHALSKIPCDQCGFRCSIFYRKDPGEMAVRTKLQPGSVIFINGKKVPLGFSFPRKSPELDNFVVYEIADREIANRVVVLASNRFSLLIRYFQSCLQDEKEAKELENPLKRYMATFQEVDHEGRGAFVERIEPVTAGGEDNSKVLVEFMQFQVLQDRTVQQLEEPNLWGFNDNRQFRCMKMVTWGEFFNLVALEQCAWNWIGESFKEIMAKIHIPFGRGLSYRRLQGFFRKIVEDSLNGIKHDSEAILRQAYNIGISQSKVIEQGLHVEIVIEPGLRIEVEKGLHVEATKLRSEFIEKMKKEYPKVEDLEKYASKALSDAYANLGYATIPSPKALQDKASLLFRTFIEPKLATSPSKTSSPFKSLLDRAASLFS